MTTLPDYIKREAAKQRQIRLNQPRITSAEAKAQYERVMRQSQQNANSHLSPG